MNRTRFTLPESNRELGQTPRETVHIARAQPNESGLRAPIRGRATPVLGGREPEDWADPDSWRPSWQGTGDIARRHDDLDGRKAIAVVGAFLCGLGVGLLVMRAVVAWGWLS